jgi:hypothetical protein
MDKMERMIAEKVTIDPVDVVPVVLPVVPVEGAGAGEQADEVNPGEIPVGMQTPAVTLRFGLVVFPVQPGPMYVVVEVTELLQEKEVL